MFWVKKFAYGIKLVLVTNKQLFENKLIILMPSWLSILLACNSNKAKTDGFWFKPRMIQISHETEKLEKS